MRETSFATRLATPKAIPPKMIQYSMEPRNTFVAKSTKSKESHHEYTKQQTYARIKTASIIYSDYLWIGSTSAPQEAHISAPSSTIVSHLPPHSEH